MSSAPAQYKKRVVALHIPLYRIVTPDLYFDIAFRTMGAVIVPVLRQSVSCDHVKDLLIRIDLFPVFFPVLYSRIRV